MYTAFSPNVTTRCISTPSFGTTFVLPSKSAIFDDKKNIFNFSDRYEEIKKYNPEKASIIKLLQLDDEEYKTVLDAIRKFPKREIALLNHDSKLSVSKSKNTFNGITDKVLGLSFSNGYGFYSAHRASNDFGDLHVSRETSNIDGRDVIKFLDRSRFNEEYYIENAYSEILDCAHGCRTTKARKISIKDCESNPILNYEYSRKYFPDSKHCEFNVNGRIYNTKVCQDGKVAITSGKQGEVLDFSKAMEKFSENSSEKETFVMALRLLPPQILLELNDTFEMFFKDDKKPCLYSPTVAADSMINSTIERLANKNSLCDDKELVEIFSEEKDNFIKWLENNSDGRIRKYSKLYIKEHLNKDEEIMEVIKSVCNLLWMEEYEENRADDEGKRLLLNFFPETVNFIVSRFELNTAAPKV